MLGTINNNISTALYHDHVYKIQSDVSLEIFQSFVNYLFNIDTNVPNITPENVNLRKVHFDENSQLSVIKKNAFVDSTLETITIPSDVVKINSHAFVRCKHLRAVDFAPNSEIQIFNNDIFLGCSIQNLTIPANVKM